MMNTYQREKYNRHIILPEFGEAAQEKLFNSKVLVVGAGGLGAPVLYYLVAAGIGTIGIVDQDKVSLSNLQRQILYKENQCGESKVAHAKENLLGINPNANIQTFELMLTEENGEEIMLEYDIVVGATDNFESRFIIDKYSKKLGIPFIHGSICEFQGQLSVFNYKNGPSYVDLFSDTPGEALPLGVMGVLPGVIGSMQAIEVIKIVTGLGEVMSGKLLIYDALTANQTIVDI